MVALFISELHYIIPFYVNTSKISGLLLPLKQQINLLADQCVKCGMCLPGCPTYQLSHNENESPRGRIALMQGIVNDQLALSSRVIEHLDHCLGCLGCEKICPSDVQYQILIDAIREYTQTKQSPLTAKAQAGFISLFINPTIQNGLFALLRFYQFSGFQKLLRFSGILKLIGIDKQEQLLPKLQPQLTLQPRYSSTGDSLGTVALFIGCMGKHFEQSAIQASIQVLTRLGFDVEIPEQVCCGALHQHSGFHHQAETLAKTNMQFLQNNHYTAVLFTASGCGAQLQSSLKTSPLPITSLMDFILQQIKKTPVVFNAIEQHIALHQPCSLQNTLRQADAVTAMLTKIPGLKITELQSQCCGAAGKNMLTQADLAAQIRQPLLNQIPDSITGIVSSNIGCTIHISAGCHHKIPVIHPIELVAKSLQ